MIILLDVEMGLILDWGEVSQTSDLCDDSHSAPHGGLLGPAEKDLYLEVEPAPLDPGKGQVEEAICLQGLIMVRKGR